MSPTVNFQQCHISCLVRSNSLFVCALTLSESSIQMPIRILNLSTLTAAGNVCRDLLRCGPQVVKGSERTVVLFGMSCHESYAWSDNISLHSWCHKARKKLPLGFCVGMNKRTSTWKRVYWHDSIAKRETYTHTVILQELWSFVNINTGICFAMVWKTGQENR